MGEEQGSLTHHHGHREMGLRRLAVCPWNVSLSCSWGALLFGLSVTKSSAVTLHHSDVEMPIPLLLFLKFITTLSILLACEVHFLFPFFKAV